MGSSCKHRMGETRHSARHDFPQPKSGLLAAGGLWRAIWLVGGIGCIPAVPQLSPETIRMCGCRALLSCKHIARRTSHWCTCSKIAGTFQLINHSYDVRGAIGCAGEHPCHLPEHHLVMATMLTSNRSVIVISSIKSPLHPRPLGLSGP